MLPLLSTETLLRATWRRVGYGTIGGALVIAVALLAMAAPPLVPWWVALVAPVVLGTTVAWRGHRRGPPGAVGTLALVLFGAGLALLLYLFFARALAGLAAVEGLGGPGSLMVRLTLVRQLLGLVLTFASFLLLLSMPAAALSSIYLAPETTLQLLSPRSPLATFVTRFAVAAGRVSYMVLLVLLPCLLAVGRELEAAPLFYLVAPVVLLLLLVPPLVAGSAVTALLVRLFPTARLQQVLTVVTVAALAAAIILIRASGPERLLALPTTADLEGLRGALGAAGIDGLPGAWAAEALMSAVGGGLAWRATAGLVLVGLGAVVLVLPLAATHRRVCARAHERSAQVRSAAARWPRGIVPLLWLKDLRLLVRDAREWSQGVVLVGVVILYLYNIRSLPSELGAFRLVVVFVNHLVLGFILAGLNLRFTYVTLALEGPGLWSLLKSPISRRRALRAKALSTQLPLTLFAGLLAWLGGWSLRVTPVTLGVGVGLGLLLSLVLHQLALALGIRNYRVGEHDPLRMALSAGGLVYMVAAMGYVVVAVSCTAPAMVGQSGRITVPPLLIVTSLSLVLALSAAVAFWARRVAVRSLDRLEL